MITDSEVREIIPFPVWIIPSPVLKIEYQLGGTPHTLLMGGTIGVGTLHNIERKSLCIIQPLRGSILQAGTCQNPRWSPSVAIFITLFVSDEGLIL